METDKHTKKPHYAWWILASCIAFYSATMGVIVNTQGIFMPPILEEMGWSATQYSSPFIISGLAAVVTLTFVDKIYKRFTVKPVLFLAVTFYTLVFMQKATMHSYLHYCIVMTLLGVGSAFVLYVPVPMLLNAWFEEKRGFAIGAAVLSSGVAGTIVNPIISSIIESRGWRTGIVVTAIIAMVISLPFIIFVVREKPEDMGLLPYGAKRSKDEQENAVDPEYSKSAQEHINTRFSKEEVRRKFIYCIIIASMLNLLSVVSSHLANFAATLGLAASIGAVLSSTNMVGNLFSKALLGTCMDRFGQYKALLVSMAAVFIGYLLLAVSPKAIFLMYVAAFILGCTAAHNTMAAPAILGSFAIGEEYNKLISKVSMGTMFANAFANTITCSIMERTGTYVTVWVFYALLEIVCIILLMVFYRGKRK